MADSSAAPIRVLIAADVDPSLATRLAADRRFAVRHTPVKSEDDLALIVDDCEVLVTRAYNKVTRRVLERASKLRLVAQGTSGIDNIDLDAARERGVEIIHLPGGNANAVAELVIGYLISMTRTIPFYTRQMVGGVWTRDDCATRHELAHHRLGIVGLGQVGRRVARLATAFGMTVQAFDPYITDDDFAARHAGRVDSLEALLRTSDIVTLHVPLTEETRGMIGVNDLAQLRRGSYVVNACRGEVLDRDAALSALADDHLGGLALDVYDPEPPSAPFPDDPRLILTPHIAGCSHECKTAIGAELYEKLVAWMDQSNQ